MNRSRAKAKVFITWLLVFALLFTYMVPLALAAPAWPGTAGDDVLNGIVYDFGISGSTPETVTDALGGDDTLTNVTIKNSGSGSGKATFVQTAGSYTVSGTLTLSNIAMQSSNMILNDGAIISASSLLSGSSITFSSISGTLPRTIVTGISASELSYFTAPSGISLNYLNGSVIASNSTSLIVLFDGNGATLGPDPLVVSASGGTVSALPYPPQKTGYTFSGWNTAADGSGTVFDETTTVSSSMTVYAKWVVQATPVFTKNPLSQTTAVGSAVVFTANATGYPTPTFQWQKSTDNGITWSDIADAVSPSYTVANPQLTDNASQYRCVATNEVAAVNSSVATLTVSNTVTPTLSSSDTTVDFGQVATGTNSPSMEVTVSGTGLTDAIAYTVAGTNPGDFTVTKGTWNSLTGGTLKITFKPGAAGARSATLTLTSTGAAPVDIALTGEGVSASAPLIAVNRASVSFGNIVVNSTSGSQTIVITGSNLTNAIDYSTLTGDTGAFTVTAGSGWNSTTGGSLVVTFTPTAVQAYSATLTIKSGTAEQKVIALSGNGIAQPPAPSLTVDPSSLNFNTVYTGSLKTLPVTVTGTVLPSDIVVALSGSDSGLFSFEKGSGWSNTQGGTIDVTFTPTASGAKAAILTISADGGISKTVNLTATGALSTAPQFNTQPADKTVSAGANATFTVAVTGTPTPTLQWQKSTDNGATWNDIASETGSSLTLNNVAAGDDASLYHCVAKNAANPSGVTSSSAKLTVTYPKLTVSPTSASFGNVTIGSEKSQTFTVSGVNLTGNITYSLAGTDAAAFKDAEVSWTAAAGGTMSITFKPTEKKAYDAVLKFSSAGAADVSINLSGTGTLVVPSFTTQPQNQSKIVGESASFSVELATGTADYTLRWEKSTNGTDWSTITGATSKQLALSNVALGDTNSQYRCVAVYTAGGGGTVNSNPATLTVTSDHKITESPAKITEKGKAGTFKINGDVTKVTGLKINDKPMTLEGTGTSTVKVKNGTTEIGTMTAGSVVLTFNATYLDSLANGTYKVEVVFNDGFAVGSFEISRATSSGNGNSPNTNDEANLTLWILLIAVSSVSIILLLVLKKKPKK